MSSCKWSWLWIPVLLGGVGLASAAPKSPDAGVKKASPVVRRVTALDCKAGKMTSIGRGCDSTTAPISVKACKGLKLGDRVRLGGLLDPKHKKSAARKVTRIGLTTETTGRLILRDCISGFVQTMDSCGLQCTAQVTPAECKTVKLEALGTIKGKFQWSPRGCKVGSPKLVPAK